MTDTRKKRICPKCKRLKLLGMFRRDDPAGWCKACRARRAGAPKAAAANYNPPADDGPVCSAPTELNLGDRRVVIIQRIGSVVRITAARREKRNETDSLVNGSTVLLPLQYLDAILTEVRAAATDED